jgi:hypothetical protein
MITTFWLVLYLVSWLIHGSWWTFGMWASEKWLKVKRKAYQVAVTIACWIGVVILCSGCPFMYVHQYIEVKAGWREKITYQYQDSVVYKFIIQPIHQPFTRKGGQK